jgi:rhodanese-related sulfurtransferase
MKRYIFSLFLWTALSLFTACSEHKSETAEQTLVPADFQQQLQAHKGVLLDVRTPEEFNEGHLGNAMNIDYKNSDFKDQLQKLDKTKPYFVYCKAGVRSEKATEIMKEQGFTEVYHMKGGIDAWKEQGLPMAEQ